MPTLKPRGPKARKMSEGIPTAALVDAIDDGVVAVDPERRRVRYVNEGFRRLTGHDPTADPTGWDGLVRRLLGAAGTGDPFVHDTETADGDPLTVEVQPSETSVDGERLVVGVLRDVTGRIEREQTLEQYRRVVRTMPDGVFVLDESGRMVGGNAEMARMVGWEVDDLEGRAFASLVEDGVLTEAAVAEYLDVVGRIAAGETDGEMVEVTVHPPGRGERVYQCHVTARPPVTGPFNGVVGIARDVTERVEREAELERQNERLDEFAGVVSHDLRNPINVAQGRLPLYRREGATEHLDAVERAVDRMDAIVTDLLTLAREGETVGETAPVSLATAAERAWDVVDTGKAELVVTEETVIKADAGRLGELLENLFCNAVEHGSHDGPVTVTVGQTDAGFFVADDGPGIPADQRESVFERGVSTAADGTGLGLAIVRAIASAHGWSVDLVSAEDGGARFELASVTRASAHDPA